MPFGDRGSQESSAYMTLELLKPKFFRRKIIDFLSALYRLDSLEDETMTDLSLVTRRADLAEKILKMINDGAGDPPFALLRAEGYDRREVMDVINQIRDDMMQFNADARGEV